MSRHEASTPTPIAHLRRASRALVLALAAGALAAIPAGPAHAQPPAAQRAGADEEARGLFIAGQAAFEAGRYGEALEHFRHAYELSGRPALLYNIAIAADRLRRDDEAIEAFEQFLHESPADAPQRADVQARLDALREAARERESSEETGASASETALDAETGPVERGASGDAVPLEPWLVIGGATALAVGGAVLLGLGVAEAESVNAAPAGTPWNDVAGAADRAGWMTPTGAVVLGIGVAGAALGVTWLALTEPGAPDEPAPANARLRVGPTGIAIAGEF